MRALVMPTARRLGLFLLLVGCTPLIMAAGGGPGFFQVVQAFNDLNHDGEQNLDEPDLPGVEIHVFGRTSDGTAVHMVATTDAGGAFFPALNPGTYTVCEVLQPGWTQSGPLAVPLSTTESLADCTGHTDGGTIVPSPRGYTFTLLSGFESFTLNFANFQGGGGVPNAPRIRGTKFNDLNGNGVQDPGEPGIAGWEIHLLIGTGDTELGTKPQPGPPVHARLTVDRHTLRPSGGERADTCDADYPGCSTTTGGLATLVLTRGSRTAKTTFNVNIPFQLGCAAVPKESEIFGALISGIYIPLAAYWMPPPDVLANLFTQIGVPIDPPTYAPIFKKVRSRRCIADPNPANGAGAGVREPGILVAEVEIAFASLVNKVVAAESTTTNASGEYEFTLPPGASYTVCESLRPGWRQTFPGNGSGGASCVGSNVDLGPRGYIVRLDDPGDMVQHIDFGNVSDAQLWLGLKSSDDQGTQFDVKVELLKNASLVASGLRRCVTGLTRNPTSAQGVRVAWDSFNPVSLAPTDALVLKVSTRIGTNTDDTQCAPERGSSHSSARGVRLYYDAASRPSHVDPPLASGSNQVLYLDSNGTACPGGGAESSNVTDRTLTGTAPSGTAAKCKDSSAVTFSGGNPFKEVGTWTLR